MSREWTWTPDGQAVLSYEQLPPDYTPDDDLPQCGAWRNGYGCTRQPGHTGRHAAGTGERIVAVWP